ncbi:MAG: glycosyltransferase [uncultured bacterium]|nr:MAG: glycosyltransferase [uncultured bacterium]OGH13123.1 MAG: hypothetical protein A2687_00860 [Candidatus Levybacteria bacterium RIFCSPHIGHO2_01_FULL_38_26]
MTDKISLVIITRNRAKMLEVCLESLTKQSILPDEIIVVDNASTDNTKEVIASYSSSDTTPKLPIRYIYEKRIGMPYAQNRGIKEVSGDIMLFLDDDCVAEKHWTENMIKSHKKYPKAWAIQGRTYSITKNKTYGLLAEFNRFISVQKHAKTNHPLSMEKYFSKNFNEEIEFLTIDGNNFSLKRSYLKKYKLHLDEKFYRGLDTDLGKQIIEKNGSIVLFSNTCVFHQERSTLYDFLEQRWHTGRTTARIEKKWKFPSLKTNMIQFPKKTFYFFLFCKISSPWANLPLLLFIFLLDKLYYLNGYFYEKRLLSLSEQ